MITTWIHDRPLESPTHKVIWSSAGTRFLPIRALERCEGLGLSSISALTGLERGRRGTTLSSRRYVPSEPLCNAPCRSNHERPLFPRDCEKGKGLPVYLWAMASRNL